jgi:hypothetical protein
MVRAANLASIDPLTDAEELMTTMPTHVREGGDVSIGLPREQNRLRPQFDRSQLTGGEEVVKSAETHPSTFEQLLLLPGEYVRGRVRICWQRPALTT